MFTSNNTTDMKCNKTPVGPLQLMFLMEAFSTLAELIRIIVDKKLYLVSISWPPEDIKSTPPPVLSVMMDQVDLNIAELNPIWFTSISKLTDGPYPDSLQMETKCVHENNIVINGNPPCKWFTHLTNESNIAEN